MQQCLNCFVSDIYLIMYEKSINCLHTPLLAPIWPGADSDIYIKI